MTLLWKKTTNNKNLWNRFWDLNSGFQSCIASALTHGVFTPALAINNWFVLSFCVSHFTLLPVSSHFDVYMYKGHMCQDTLVEVSGQLSQVGALLLPCVFPGWAQVVSIGGSAVHWSLSYTLSSTALHTSWNFLKAGLVYHPEVAVMRWNEWDIPWSTSTIYIHKIKYIN